MVAGVDFLSHQNWTVQTPCALVLGLTSYLLSYGRGREESVEGNYWIFRCFIRPGYHHHPISRSGFRYFHFIDRKKTVSSSSALRRKWTQGPIFATWSSFTAYRYFIRLNQSYLISIGLGYCIVKWFLPYPLMGWQVSQTNARRPSISKRRIFPLHAGHSSFANILTRSRYGICDGCPSSTVIMALRFTPSVSSALASSQIWLNVCRSMSLPGVSGWTDWRHKISER